MFSILTLCKYETIMYYIMNGFYTVLLWRGHFGLDMYLPCGKDTDEKWKFSCLRKNTIYLPLYSIVLFISGVTLVEKPTLIIPYFFLFIVCTMLGIMSFKNANPSPWVQTKTFDDFLSILLFGKQLSVQKNDSITPDQNKEEARLYRKELEDRLMKHQKEKQEQILEYTKAQDEQTKFTTEVWKLKEKSKIALRADREAILMAPFKPIIYPYQLMLANTVYMLRFASSILVWENSFASFWITFISSILFLVCLVIPWSFILTWLTRIIVWTILGPWMKIADFYYFTQLEQLTREEQDMQKEQARKLRREAYDKALTKYRIKQEDATKLRDIKKCMYGDYIVNVPKFHLQMQMDNPLPESSARSFDKKASKEIEPFHVASQCLVGDMIPIPVGEAIAIAAKEKEEEFKNKPPPSLTSCLKSFLSRSGGDDELEFSYKTMS